MLILTWLILDHKSVLLWLFFPLSVWLGCSISRKCIKAIWQLGQKKKRKKKLQEEIDYGGGGL